VPAVPADALAVLVTGRGLTPAVLLDDPKYAHNVGMAYRTCALLGAAQLWYTGDRAEAEWQGLRRLPREERLRQYLDRTELIRAEGRWLRQFPPGTVPVAVEVSPTAEDLAFFEHPEQAVYVFGPEDGSLGKGIRSACHRFVILPSDGGPLNLAVAVGAVLMDRRTKRLRAGLEEPGAPYARVRAIS
jgi:tRNA(Leu) C34 or U34 (ribose-2'-O)-methylase TrmL